MILWGILFQALPLVFSVLGEGGTVVDIKVMLFFPKNDPFLTICNRALCDIYIIILLSI